MKTYNVHEAKTNLSKILNEVKEGEIVYIAKAGEIVAEMKPISKRKPFPWGKYKDQIWTAEDWDSDETNQEIAKTFYQESLDDPEGKSEVDGEVHPDYQGSFYEKKSKN